MSQRTPDQDENIPGAIREEEHKTEGHFLHRKGAKPQAGLFVQSKYEMANADFDDRDGSDEDEEEKNGEDGEEEEKGPLIDDHSANVGCSILNSLFGMLLVVAMCMPGTDSGIYILIVIFIGAAMAVCSSVSFVYFIFCFWDTQPFQDQIEEHIEQKKNSDPAFAKKMKRGWIVQDRLYVDDMMQYLTKLAQYQVMQEGVEEGAKNMALGGAAIQSDGEDIIDDDDDRETGTRNGEHSPRTETAGSGTYASMSNAGSSRADPAKTSGSDPDAGIEMTKIIVPSKPIETPDMDAIDDDSSERKSILKKQDSEPKKHRNVSFAGKGNLFENPEEAEEIQKMADLQEIREDEEYEAGEKAKTDDGVDEPSNEPEIDNDDQAAEDQAPDNFYDILFSAAHLKVSFWKFKEALKEKVPNGFDLDGMDEKELSDIISSRPTRKRILAEASKLATKIKTDEKGSDHGDPTQSSANDSDSDDVGFLGAPADDLSDDEEVLQ